MAMPSCPRCGSPLRDVSLCEQCGWTSHLPATTTPTPREFCPYDGARLGRLGVCTKTGGFPVGLTCPFACPLCRRELEWDGRCAHCHGNYTGVDREGWTFPGDRYELYDDKGHRIGDGRHWIKVDGPRAACSREENLANMQELRRVLGRIGVAPAKTPTRGPGGPA